MKRLIIFTALAAFGTTSVHATGGFVCKTAGPRPIEVAVGFGHVPGAPIILSQLRDNGRDVPVRAPQWWLDNQELRLVLTDPNATRREAIIKTVRSGQVYDGSLWRGAQRHWVRCRES